MSTYVRDRRAQIGTDLLEFPTVSAIVIDDSDRVLLVCRVDFEPSTWTP